MDDVLGNTVDALHSYLHLSIDECDSLSKHVEASEQKHNVIKEAGESFANYKMRDVHVEELVSQNQEQISIRLKLKT